MAHEATNWAYKLNLPMAQKFVLVALADRADEEFSCFPGQKTLAKMIGASVETVRRALAELESKGLISRQRRVRDSGYRTSDRYFLAVGETPTETPTGQIAHKAESGTLPVNLPTLTGQSEGANESSGEPPVESLVQTTPKQTSAEFDQWYSAYPRKEAKEAARKAFTKARKRVSFDELVSGLSKYCQTVKNRDREFIAQPASWLNAGRWEDEDPTVPPSTSPWNPEYHS